MNLNQSPVQIARWLKSPNTDNIFEVDPTMFEPRLMFEQSLRRGLNSASRQVLGTYWAVAEGSGVASGKTNLKKIFCRRYFLWIETFVWIYIQMSLLYRNIWAYAE